MRIATGCLVVLAAAVVFAGCQSASQPAATAETAHSAAQAFQPPDPPSASPSKASPSAPSRAQTVTLLVHGMGCPLCANNVDKQLLKLPNVQQVNVDLGSGQVKLTMAPGSPPPPQPQLAKAVAHSGYTLVKVQTP